MARVDLTAIAALARLDIAPEARERLQRDMESIIGYIELLGELDVTGIEPTAHACELHNVWREDEACEPAGRDAMLANAPETLQGILVKVPPVLPGEGMS